MIPSAFTLVAKDIDSLGRHWRSLRSSLQDIESVVKVVSGDHDLILSHWLVLLRLHDKSPMPQSDLRMQTDLDSGFLTRVLDDLAARRLVQRTRDIVDRRRMHLKITGQGRAAVNSMLIAAAGSRLLESLTNPYSALQSFASDRLTRARQS